MPHASEQLVPICIILRRPPAGVRFALQHGDVKGGVAPALEAVQDADGEHDLAFPCTLRVRPGEGETLRFLGPFAHGPATARFVYITVGQSAGQRESPWQRRAKIPLTGITPALVRNALDSPGAVLQATIEGTLRDGSPTCATRPFVAGGSWTIHTRR